MTKVRICNRALVKLGADTVISLSGDSAEASLCNIFFDDVVDEVLQDFEWTCAIERKDLARSSDSPVSGYEYQYPLPSSPWCLRVLEIVDSTATYRIEGRMLLTDIDEVSIRYIKRITDTNLFPPLLAECIALKLASVLCTKITESSTGGERLLQEYYLKLAQAKGKNQMEATEPDPKPNLWIDEGR